MSRAKMGQQTVIVLVIFITFFSYMGYKNKVYAVSTPVTQVIRQGMRSEEVLELQKKLKELNFFNASETGYFGSKTKMYVMSFQRSNNLVVDVVVGPQTAAALYKQQPRVTSNTISSRGEINRQDSLVPWFGEAEKIFALGTEALVTDVDTGISFKAVRTGGSNHSDTETVSKEDTKLLKTIFGGSWSWQRRAVIVTIGNRKIAASMTGMPHAGREDMPARVVVNDRSSGYGTGVNYDSIKGNDMSGHFDIHFLGSRTHGTNRVDAQHQSMVMKAARSLNH